MRRSRLLSIGGRMVAVAFMATLTACPKPAPTPASRQQPPARAASPLAGLAGQHVVVLPVHYIKADTIGWAASIGAPRETLVALDSAIERSLGERGFRTEWTFPPALARSAKRNAGYVPDPYSLAAERLRTGVMLSDNQLREPLASQVRGVVAVTDARYVLFPVELRFEPVAEGGARSVLHVVLLDARGSKVVWAGDVRGAARPRYSDVALESVALALADLVAAP
ncbi:MAG TPA: hypothetical protein VHM30_08070 [Gemmatimonadaceae bacterium]|nr:hypothetical protein [Gemmatimonadaceae bacterium]